MTNAEYHARAEISKSDLFLLFEETPYALKIKKEFGEKAKSTPSEILGSCVHKLVLEADDFFNEFAIEPTCDKRTKDGKAEFEKFTAENQGKTILKADIFETAKQISDSVLHAKSTAKFLKDGKAEQSYFSEFVINGIKIPVKCRPDFYNENLGLIIDLKTATSVKKSGFKNAVGNYAYDMQVAFYTDILESLGKKVNSFLFIVVENKEPFSVAFYELERTSNAFQSGREFYQKLLKEWAECVRDDFYPNEIYSHDENGKKILIQKIEDIPISTFYKRADNGY